ncbi:MAG TPA: ABC transporter permease [Terriglobales bacterium]|nr:ABC transporter permease [Terriglobales bacterium]
MKSSFLHFLQIMKVSIRALTKNKMRTFLTALGIIIGVGAVIAMVSIGEGAKRGIQDRFNSMGTNLLFVYPGNQNVQGVRSQAGSRTSLKEDDAKAILQYCDAVRAISPSVNSRGQVVYANKNWNTQISGTGADYPDIRSWPVEDGTYFDDAQVRAAGKVCVLGSEVAKNLFDQGQDPVGQVIRIRSIPFRVLGVLKSKGESGGFFNRDDMIAVPYTTCMRRFAGIDYVNSIDVSAVSSDMMAEAKREIEVLLRDRHKIMPGSDDDFTVRNMSDVAESAAESTQIMTILLGSIAGISLLVGGIGIMNIMLVSVTERTREIGIRMAVGAKTKAIRQQFIAEAVTLSMVGGIIGTLGGVAVSKIISALAGWSTVITPFSIILAVSFSAIIGIFFGYYPAYKASLLDPIAALRYE